MNTVIPSILVVDDDIQFLEMVKTYLLDIANVEVATSGKMAIQMAQQLTLDLILLDYDMPIMDGVKTLAHLRKLHACINVPIIMLTGRSDRNAVTASMVMGIDGYLLKPVSKDVLIDTVLDTLSKYSEIETKRTVVAIDDDMSYLKQINNLLSHQYHVVMINSAKLALNYLSNHLPDIILLDYQMPLFNGITMMKMMQQNEAYEHIPFIILSGTLDIGALTEFFPLKPAAILAKPIEKEVLIEHIEKALTADFKEE